MRLDSKIDECGLDYSYPNKVNVSKGNTQTLDQLMVNKMLNKVWFDNELTRKLNQRNC